MEPTLRDYISIIWVHLILLAFILSELVDREAGMPKKDDHPLIDYRVNGNESILMHLPRK